MEQIILAISSSSSSKALLAALERLLDLINEDVNMTGMAWAKGLKRVETCCLEKRDEGFWTEACDTLYSKSLFQRQCVVHRELGMKKPTKYPKLPLQPKTLLPNKIVKLESSVNERREEIEINLSTPQKEENNISVPQKEEKIKPEKTTSPSDYTEATNYAKKAVAEDREGNQVQAIYSYSRAIESFLPLLKVETDLTLRATVIHRVEGYLCRIGILKNMIEVERLKEIEEKNKKIKEEENQRKQEKMRKARELHLLALKEAKATYASLLAKDPNSPEAISRRSKICKFLKLSSSQIFALEKVFNSFGPSQTGEKSTISLQDVENVAMAGGMALYETLVNLSSTKGRVSEAQWFHYFKSTFSNDQFEENLQNFAMLVSENLCAEAKARAKKRSEDMKELKKKIVQASKHVTELEALVSVPSHCIVKDVEVDVNVDVEVEEDDGEKHSVDTPLCDQLVQMAALLHVPVSLIVRVKQMFRAFGPDVKTHEIPLDVVETVFEGDISMLQMLQASREDENGENSVVSEAQWLEFCRLLLCTCCPNTETLVYTKEVAAAFDVILDRLDFMLKNNLPNSARKAAVAFAKTVPLLPSVTETASLNQKAEALTGTEIGADLNVNSEIITEEDIMQLYTDLWTLYNRNKKKNRSLQGIEKDYICGVVSTGGEQSADIMYSLQVLEADCFVTRHDWEKYARDILMSMSVQDVSVAVKIFRKLIVEEEQRKRSIASIILQGKNAMKRFDGALDYAKSQKGYEDLRMTLQSEVNAGLVQAQKNLAKTEAKLLQISKILQGDTPGQRARARARRKKALNRAEHVLEKARSELKINFK
eukprot:g3251.t1